MNLLKKKKKSRGTWKYKKISFEVNQPIETADYVVTAGVVALLFRKQRLRTARIDFNLSTYVIKCYQQYSSM